MKSKKILAILAVVMMLIVPFSVFAATSDTPVAKTVRGFFGIDVSNLSDQQKADLTDYAKKMADLQKEFINRMVDNGSMTKEQGDAAIQRIDEAIQDGDITGFLKGMGKGGFGGHEKRGEFGMGRIDTSKLTDQQKADLTDTLKKMADTQKDFINAMVDNGTITKVQGDTAVQRIDDMLENLDSNGLTNGMMMGKGVMGGLGFKGLFGVDVSKLTDEQKADLTNYSQKMAELQKELVNKMVTSGLMTQEQGDAAVQRIDDMQKNIAENGFPTVEKGFGGRMKKGRFQ